MNWEKRDAWADIQKGGGSGFYDKVEEMLNGYSRLLDAAAKQAPARS